MLASYRQLTAEAIVEMETRPPSSEAHAFKLFNVTVAAWINDPVVATFPFACQDKHLISHFLTSLNKKQASEAFII